MADSSIGGKTAVDTSFGKNLVGAFKQPHLVVIDLETLRSLPPREFRSGMAEIVKAALIAGGEPFERLHAQLLRQPLPPHDDAPAAWSADDTLAALEDAIRLKRRIVEADPLELNGARALLNFGHTFGHGIEAWSGFRLRHGEAIALGMLCAARLSQRLGLCSADAAQMVIALLRAAGLPTSLRQAGAYLDGLPFDVDVVWRYMQSDKKKSRRALQFVLLRQPGDVFISDAATEADARRALESLASSD